MKVTHKLNEEISKQTKEVSFLLSNKIGGYTLLRDTPTSRYQGVFMMHKSEMYKVIEDIQLLGAGSTKEIINEFSFVKRRKSNNTEKFFMPYGYDALVYELDTPGEIEITLDIRKSYSNPEMGRNYKIQKTKSGIIISYKDNESTMYLVISPKGDYKILDEWVKKEYSSDKERNSQPHEKYVYQVLKVKAQKLIFTFSPSKKQAVEEATYITKNLKRLYDHQKIYVNTLNLKKPADIEQRMAKQCAMSSMNKLLVHPGKKKGFFAGLPWFFQFWSRDELISAKSLQLNKQDRVLKDVLLKNLNMLKKGFLPNIAGSKEGNADAIGWLFKRVQDALPLFSKSEKAMIAKKLTESIFYYNKYLLHNNLVYNRAKSTWMDTEWHGDDREGYRIEIQALFLNMLGLAAALTKDNRFKQWEKIMRKTVRDKFWNKSYLADGLEDWTIRPNVFIAAYIYPALLSRSEWTTCFQNILPKLWLKWGGLSSIDKSHSLFTSKSTGESVESYHRGDSWFWVNNLAALVMKKVNKVIFVKYIDAITRASTKEILYSGAIGHHAEISSANSLKSEGCIAQAWSAAMYIELLES